MSPRVISRRAFLQRTAIVSAGGLLSGMTALHMPGRSPIRVRGRVTREGVGLPGVAVSDGLNVVRTRPDGSYSFLADRGQPFVWVSIPDGAKVPTSPAGTAAFYRRLPTTGDEAEASFSLARAEAAPNHAFLLLADPQTQDDYEMNRLHSETVPDVLDTVSALSGRSVFGVSCGDIMYDNLMLYRRYEEAVEKTGVPFFQVVGNHDLDHAATDEGSVGTFCEHFGPRYYSFDRGEIHYVALDNVFWFGSGYIGYVDADQLYWLENDLRGIEQGRTVVVFLHIPLLSTQFRRSGLPAPGNSLSVTNRDALYRLLEPYNAHVLSGHTHEQEHVFEGGVHEHVHGAVCGAWWSGDICGDGTPNGYGVYEANGSTLKWRYKATGMPADHQIRAYAAGADPSAPEEIVANVWDWEPEWRVFWYEGGERRGAMSRRIGTDPLSEKLHRGAGLPSRRPWVEPLPVAHLFYCPAQQNDRPVTIEAVDRWGRTYTSSVPPLSY